MLQNTQMRLKMEERGLSYNKENNI